MDLTGIARDVLAYLGAQAIELSDDLGEAEATLLEQSRVIGARALEIHLAGRRLGYEGSSRACPCKANQRFIQHRSKTIATLLGAVTIRRAYYHCVRCGASRFPYDQRIGLGDGQVSEGLAKAATVVAVPLPFETASRVRYELTGQRVSERTVERLTHRVGGLAAQQEEQAAEPIERWDPPAAEACPERLYVAVDGTMVEELDGWHEVKTVTCYWDTADGRREARYTARFEAVGAFLGFVWALACRSGLGRAKEVILLGDGARWIWDRVGGLFEGATHIVDGYHAMEHVWACGRALHGHDTPATGTWVKDKETLLWDGNVRGLLERLEVERARAPTKRNALDASITYLTNQDDRLAYDRFRARGLDIGSGRVEAACKAVVGARMKRSGMRWSRRGAQSTLSLRVAWINGAWDAVWASHPLAA